MVLNGVVDLFYSPKSKELTDFDLLFLLISNSHVIYKSEKVLVLD